MRVKELIVLLKQMPPSLEVVIGDGTSVETVSLDRYENLCNCDDGIDGDGNPIEGDKQVVLVC
jgi:hypothetical protein